MEPASIAAFAIIGIATAYAFSRKMLLSLVYGVTILAVYALQALSAPLGYVVASPITMDLGVVASRGSIATPWSWATFEFVHGSETHVLLNLLGLILISPGFEERIGRARWAVLFFVGGAFGALVFVLVHAGQTFVLIGASAGIFATFGAYGRLYPRERVNLFLPLPRIRPLPVIQAVVIFLVLELIFGAFLAGGIAWEAHAGALLFGFAAGPSVMRLPLRGGRVAPRLQSLGGWRDLATTPELTRILDEAEKADLPETREAWVDKFVAAARCPRCGGPLRMRFGHLASPCGWRRSA